MNSVPRTVWGSPNHSHIPRQAEAGTALLHVRNVIRRQVIVLQQMLIAMRSMVSGRGRHERRPVGQIFLHAQRSHDPEGRGKIFKVAAEAGIKNAAYQLAVQLSTASANYSCATHQSLKERLLYVLSRGTGGGRYGWQPHLLSESTRCWIHSQPFYSSDGLVPQTDADARAYHGLSLCVTDCVQQPAKSVTRCLDSRRAAPGCTRVFARHHQSPRRCIQLKFCRSSVCHASVLKLRMRFRQIE